MGEYTYYIVGAVAVFFTVYFIFMFRWIKNRNNRLRNEFYEQNPHVVTTEEDKRLLAYGVPMCRSRGDKLLKLTFEDNFDANSYKGELHNDWGIEDAESAKDIILDLLRCERSLELDSMLNSPSKELKSIQKSIAKELKVDLATVEKVKSTYAWDLVRATALGKWSFWCVYLTEDEVRIVLRQSAAAAMDRGLDWDEYIISFLLGRCLDGYAMELVIPEAKELFAVFHGKSSNWPDIDIYQRFPFKALLNSRETESPVAS